MRTCQPRSLSRRATTKPSPPLLPGPHITTVSRGPYRPVMASATARPAFSISVSDATPASTASASARDISAGVSSTE
jgi:hypothetical protein